MLCPTPKSTSAPHTNQEVAQKSDCSQGRGQTKRPGHSRTPSCHGSALSNTCTNSLQAGGTEKHGFVAAARQRRDSWSLFPALTQIARPGCFTPLLPQRSCSWTGGRVTPREALLRPGCILGEPCRRQGLSCHPQPRAQARCSSAQPPNPYPGSRGHCSCLLPRPPRRRSEHGAAFSKQRLHRAARDLNRKERSVSSARSRLFVLLWAGAPRSAAAGGLALLSGSGRPQGFASHEATTAAPAAPPLPARRDLCPP